MLEVLKWFAIFFGGLWLIWFLTGGPDRQTSQAGMYIKQPNEPGEKWYLYNKSNPIMDIFNASSFSNANSGSGEIREDLEQAQELAGSSYYKDKIILRDGDTRDSDPNYEYMEITSSPDNADRVNITGWTIESMVTGQRISIEKASYLPQMYNVNYQEPIFISPGDKVYIHTGRSPIGTSFRTNLCTGYFEQFQDFNPSLRTECPLPENEPDFVTIGPNAFNDNCIDYVESIPRCQIVTEQLPLTMQPECITYINTKINYKTCVSRYKDKPNFYKPEWRIYLNRNSEMWKEQRDVIRLLDANGKVIDTISY